MSGPMTDTLKISLAQLNPTVGDLDGNAALIRQIARRDEVPIHAGAQGPLVRAPIGRTSRRPRRAYARSAPAAATARPSTPRSA